MYQCQTVAQGIGMNTSEVMGGIASNLKQESDFFVTKSLYTYLLTNVCSEF